MLIDETSGSWFTLERWICDAPFACAQQPAVSDYDVARGQNAKEILEKHWDEWISEADWVWLSDHGINTVRIPVSRRERLIAARSFDLSRLDSTTSAARTAQSWTAHNFPIWGTYFLVLGLVSCEQSTQHLDTVSEF